MAFTLDDYIDEYLQQADELDKRVAMHLKEIIPKTTHLDKKVFKKIIGELKKEMDNGRDFKLAFYRVAQKYILKGDVIKAELPYILTRIILNKAKFISFIKNKYRIPFSSRRIHIILASRNITRITHLLRKVKLSTKKVVFATFDEECKDGNPFLKDKVVDIIKMLALNKDVFDEGEPYTAVKIRYHNSEDIVKRFPTFIDAGWWDKFYPSENQNNCGRTRSLDTSLPDMPEIVHKNIEISKVLEKIEFLGDKKWS